MDRTKNSIIEYLFFTPFGIQYKTRKQLAEFEIFPCNLLLPILI